VSLAVASYIESFASHWGCEGDELFECGRVWRLEDE
jgi:hypothetical protein